MCVYVCMYVCICMCVCMYLQLREEMLVEPVKDGHTNVCQGGTHRTFPSHNECL